MSGALVRYDVTTAKPNDGREPWGTMQSAQHGHWYQALEVDRHIASMKREHEQQLAALQAERDRLLDRVARLVNALGIAKGCVPSAYPATHSVIDAALDAKRAVKP
jgi:hypothetical protein